jgi:hypothetical protein
MHLWRLGLVASLAFFTMAPPKTHSTFIILETCKDLIGEEIKALVTKPFITHLAVISQRFVEVDATPMTLDISGYLHLIYSGFLDSLAKTDIIHVNSLSVCLS